eukprot:1418964-Prorocentrum_lima.AAC.1
MVKRATTVLKHGGQHGQGDWDEQSSVGQLIQDWGTHQAGDSFDSDSPEDLLQDGVQDDGREIGVGK